jgi:hypothetical protein
MPQVSANYASMLKGIVKKYNNQNKDQMPNIAMTLNYYAHTTSNSAKAEMEQLAA